MTLTKTRRRPRGVTIIDVAKEAGVSPMTVSRVINGDAGVRNEVRAHVREVIKQLNYTPNLMARSLVTSREIRIGVIYSNPSAAFMSELLVGVFEEASTRAAQLFLLKGEQGRPPTREAIERLIDQRIAGLILAPPLGESSFVRDIIREAGLPMAVVGGVAPGALCVWIDNARAAYDMTRHLIGLGHRRIGFVHGNPDQSASIERLAGFRRAVEEEDELETRIVQGDYSYASGLRAGEELLGGERPPTAIFASNDDMAAAVVSVAHRRHLDVPGDLTVAGFDDSTAATTLWPPLTTIHQPVRALATSALQMLIQDIRGGVPTTDGQPRVTVLEHQLIERDSAAPPRS
ncbi:MULTISPECIES: LacI family DNA-binding transcriptional regulator [Sphingomonas]|jgi:LacI family transcriptional regulator, galactose operon repressor|uniref:LacI family DNA-binding transcriptional regulator n=1 Tax=Sphingomonas zeae TaxID=1646122 RepID=A0A7Y6B439_9SPHN|nr:MULTISPECIES: LacI family DNA-binding transcriptional regulator [Sphingomonas]MDK8185864.1 LacI family DNA-binding transcriptional regulator [Sphingomonas zeae]MDK8214998.1 LacI family DNA-binding transcriptional regulator [Sphingomonas sp. UMB7805-LC452B]NUU46243.1 LacI family DNA-binding transcriptional regulator [Sphingomonas zeae]